VQLIHLPINNTNNFLIASKLFEIKEKKDVVCGACVILLPGILSKGKIINILFINSTIKQFNHAIKKSTTGSRSVCRKYYDFER
jgi:hypothetical protein